MYTGREVGVITITKKRSEDEQNEVHMYKKMIPMRRIRKISTCKRFLFATQELGMTIRRLRVTSQIAFRGSGLGSEARRPLVSSIGQRNVHHTH